MKWENPKEVVPCEGMEVWVLLEHWKQNGAQSCEIYCGTVTWGVDGSVAVLNNDDIGQGSRLWVLKRAPDDDSIYTDEDPVAWAPVGVHDLPSWLGKDET